MGKFIDRTGLRYGKLFVVDRDTTIGPASKGKRVKWNCVCECGNHVVVTGHGLTSGDTRSCGCVRIQKTIEINSSHGMSRTPTYRSWQAMKDRCENPRNSKYYLYGDRGISVCDRWKDFGNFLEDMGVRPKGFTIDRIDNELGYSIDNCRWASVVEQANNKRTNVWWNGKRISISRLASRVGVPRTSLNKLIRKGLSVDDAIQHAVSRIRK